MAKLKIAVLEDNPIFLKELVGNLRLTEQVEILVYDDVAESFVEKVIEKKPEALLLDIRLGGSINGIQVAEILKLPVLFLSAERRDYLEEIDRLKLIGTFPVEEIGKTPDTEKLKTILRTFIPRVREYQKTQKVFIKPKGEDEILINPADVAFIETVKNAGNHKLNFTNRKPLIVADKTFDYFRKNGFHEEKFYHIDRPYLVNIAHAVYNADSVDIQFIDDKGKAASISLTIPDDKRKEARKLLSK